MKKISVCIVEEYFLTRLLFKQILLNDKGKEFEFNVLNDFQSADECIEYIDNNIFINNTSIKNNTSNIIPDVIMMNLSFTDKNDIKKIRDIRIKYPDIKLLIITTHEEIQEILTCLELGVSGYILKDSSKETIKEAIKEVYLDKMFIDSNITNRLERINETNTTNEENNMIKMAG